MDSNMYNEKMYNMLKIAKQSSDMSGWNDKLSHTLDSVHKNLEKYRTSYIPETEIEDYTL